jgi:hypothetical protein
MCDLPMVENDLELDIREEHDPLEPFLGIRVLENKEGCNKLFLVVKRLESIFPNFSYGDTILALIDRTLLAERNIYSNPKTLNVDYDYTRKTTKDRTLLAIERKKNRESILSICPITVNTERRDSVNSYQVFACQKKEVGS